MILTSSGHYAIPLNKNVKILDDVNHRGASITLNVTHDANNKYKAAHKLHCQFSHPHTNKLIDLVNKAGMGNDRELINCLKEVARNCNVCKVFSRPSPRPVVGLPMASEFNEVVAMDIKFLNGKMILHLIDHLSRYSAAAIINSKRPDEIVNKIFQIWISVFGPPSKFFSDNGGEFNNEKFREMCERFNITVKTTAAEAPWSNGLCERHNAVLGDMVEKTMAESGIPYEVALNWAVHAKNSLSNVHGFTPYQLAIGYTPKLPSIFDNKLPAMESVNDPTMSDVIKNHLIGMGAARKAFVECENSEKIKRALRHNMNSKNQTKFITGDSVYYKRVDSRKWKGPGKVIGQDGQQVLIKHGGVYVRVHPCRIMLEKSSIDVRSVSELKSDGAVSDTRAIEDQQSTIQPTLPYIYDESDESEECDDRVSANHEQDFNENADEESVRHTRASSPQNPRDEISQQSSATSSGATDVSSADKDNSILRKNREIQYRINPLLTVGNNCYHFLNIFFLPPLTILLIFFIIQALFKVKLIHLIFFSPSAE